ncbi:MAG: helix-turn-helix domain-containing protein [Cellulomonas sp.]|jgi:excisionase family DNA binding protein|nr:helix-turn-helix domain-containing protein [Cellulomonas sp.]
MGETETSQRFFTVMEVANLMRVSKMTVYRLLHSGELPGLRVGRSFRVPADALEAYLRSAATEATGRSA